MTNNKKLIYSYLVLILLVCLLVPFSAHAASVTDTILGTTTCGIDNLIPCYEEKIIRLLIAIASLGSIFMIIMGGIFLITAGGDPKKLSKGKLAITGAIIGLIIVLLSYSILQFVEKRLTGTTGVISGTNTESISGSGSQTNAPVASSVPGQLPSVSQDNPQAVATVFKIIFPPVYKDSTRTAAIQVKNPIDYWDCPTIYSTIHGYYPEASEGNEGDYKYYVKGFELISNATKIKAYYKKKSGDTEPFYYDEWTWESSPNGLTNWYKTPSRTGTKTTKEAVKNTCPSATTTTGTTTTPALTDTLTFSGASLNCDAIIKGIKSKYPGFTIAGLEVTSSKIDVYYVDSNKPDSENYQIWTGVVSADKKTITYTKGSAPTVLQKSQPTEPTCNINDILSQTDQTEPDSVMFDAYTIDLDNGQSYSVNIEDGKPFVVVDGQSYEIQSEKFGTYAKIDKKSLAYKRGRGGTSFFEVSYKDAAFGIVESEKLPFKYIEFDNHTPSELNGIAIDKNDNAIGEVKADKYEIPVEEAVFRGVRIKANGQAAVEYLGKTDDMDELAEIINHLDNKYGDRLAHGKKINTWIIVSNDEYNGLYKGDVGVVELNTILLDSAYKESYNQRFVPIRQTITHEYGHFLDDVMCDGVIDASGWYSGAYPSTINCDFTNIFKNAFQLFTYVSLQSGAFKDDPRYSKDPEFAETVDGINALDNEMNLLVDQNFINFPGKWWGELRSGYGRTNEAEFFTTIFTMYETNKPMFESFVWTRKNNVMKNAMRVLYLTMGKITDEKSSFPLNLEKFKKMTAEDIAMGDFEQNTPDIQINYTDPLLIYDGCNNLIDSWKVKYPDAALNGENGNNVYLKGISVTGDKHEFIWVYYKKTKGPEAHVYGDMYFWKKNGYEINSQGVDLGTGLAGIKTGCDKRIL